MLNKSDNILLAKEIATFIHDPLGFVLFAFRWGHGDLADFDGPDIWQRELLKDIGEKLKNGILQGEATSEAIREAIASGHGIGKSALVSWIVLWAMSTCPDCKGVVTANTENQLKTKTWSELAKWHRLCLCGHWFDCTATALISKEQGHERTWRIDMIPWSERNTESFAGLHNKGRRVLVIFDEASAIPDVIWEVTEGAMTDENTEILWCAFGNPTRNTGRFRECFGRFKHRWNVQRVDSRTAKMTNKVEINKWVEDYGEDSDFVRVRVRGEFPKASDNQFISSAIVHEARGKHLRIDQYSFAPRILGVDVARFGADESVIVKRQGLAMLGIQAYRQLDTQVLADIVAREFHEYKADAVFVDGIGIGAGVVDRLKRLGIYVIDAIAGARALDDKRFLNRRAEMWSEMRDWLKSGGAIPDDAELYDQLTAPEYHFSVSDKLQLESKDDMKKRGLSSPDKAEALALTFYAPVHKQSEFDGVTSHVQTRRPAFAKWR